MIGSFVNKNFAWVVLAGGELLRAAPLALGGVSIAQERGSHHFNEDFALGRAGRR